MEKDIDYSRISTPSYIFNLDVLRTGMKRLRDNLNSENKICFAIKANPFLVSPMRQYADKFEACSPGEYEICVLQGIEPERIIVSGVNKTTASMRRIVELSGGRGIYTIESPQHYQILSTVAKEFHVKLRVLVRLSNGNQFGIDKRNLEDIIALICKNASIDLIGIHFFTGTQKKIKKISAELEQLDIYASELYEKYGINLLELEYGPGLSVNYFKEDKIEDVTSQIKELNRELGKLENFSAVTIEMGRFIAAECGSFLTEVVDLKNTEGTNYVILDSGIHQINYFGQMMGMKHPPLSQISVNKNGVRKSYCLAGSLCTTNDIILRAAELEELCIGDRLLFEKCGAYSMTEGMALFLSRELPTVYFYSKAAGFQTVRNRIETYDMNSQSENER